MQTAWKLAFVTLGACFLVVASGCGSNSQREQADLRSSQAQAKVDAMKRLADAMVKNPKGSDAIGALEEFRNMPFDAQSFPKESEAIMDTYNRRIKGKYEGEVAEQVELEVASVRAGLQRAKGK